MNESIAITGLFELSISLAEHQRKLSIPISNECVPLRTSPSMPTCISREAALGRKLGAFWEKMKNYRCRSRATTKINYFRKDRFRSINSPSHFCRLAVSAGCSNIHRNKNNSELSGLVVGRLGQEKKGSGIQKVFLLLMNHIFCCYNCVLVVNASMYKKHIRRSRKK